MIHKLKKPNIVRRPYISILPYESFQVEEIEVEDFANRFLVENEPMPINNSFGFYMSQLTPLIQDFIKELENKPEFLEGLGIWRVSVAFMKAAAGLIELAPSKLGVEITGSKSIFLFSRVGTYDVHLELMFENELRLSYEAVINVFDDDGQVLNSSGKLSKVMKDLREIVLDSDREDQLSFINQWNNAISTGNTSKIEL